MSCSRNFRLYHVAVVLSLVVLGFSGCNPSGVAVVKAKGNVTYQGKPVDQALVMFIPQFEERSAAGITDSQGAFNMITPGAKQGGCVPGKYKVLITKRLFVDEKGKPVKADPTKKLKAGEAGPLYKEKSFLPEKYGNADTSGFEVEIPNEGKTDLVFDLVK